MACARLHLNLKVTGLSSTSIPALSPGFSPWPECLLRIPAFLSYSSLGIKLNITKLNFQYPKLKSFLHLPAGVLPYTVAGSQATQTLLTATHHIHKSLLQRWHGVGRR
jgi:hypothetical protein